jgi:hypothetical protein
MAAAVPGNGTHTARCQRFGADVLLKPHQALLKLHDARGKIAFGVFWADKQLVCDCPTIGTRTLRLVREFIMAKRAKSERRAGDRNKTQLQFSHSISSGGGCPFGLHVGDMCHNSSGVVSAQAARKLLSKFVLKSWNVPICNMISRKRGGFDLLQTILEHAKLGGKKQDRRKNLITQCNREGGGLNIFLLSSNNIR